MENKTAKLYDIIPFYWSEHFINGFIKELVVDYEVTDLTQVIYLSALSGNDATTIFKLCDRNQYGSNVLTPKKVNALWSAGLIDKKWNKVRDQFPDHAQLTDLAKQLWKKHLEAEPESFRNYASFVNARLYKKVVTEDHLEQLGRELLSEFPLTAKHSKTGEDYILRSWKSGTDYGIACTQDAFLQLYYKKLGYNSKPFDEVLKEHRLVIEKLKYIKRTKPVVLNQGLAHFIGDCLWWNIKLPEQNDSDSKNYGVDL